jgi:transposase-like protein
MLPHVQLDPDPRVRWFRSDGCVVIDDGPDQTRWVYLAGTLLGCFTLKQPAERDVLAAMLSGEKGIAVGKLAWAFGVSSETIRVARVRYQKGGFAALTEKRKRGAPSKQTPALVRRVRRLFEQGMKPYAVYRAIRGKVSDPTVRDMYRKWEADVAAEQAQAAAVAKGCELRLFAGPANDVDGAVCAPAAAVEPAAEGASAGSEAEPSGVEAEGSGQVEQQTQDAREEMSLEEASRHSQGRVVQHAGSWIMLGMLQAMGLYAIARQVSRGAVSQVALRVALDAVAIALSIGERCVEGVRRLATPSAALLLRARGSFTASWVRRLLKRLAAVGSAELHRGMARRHLQEALREDQCAFRAS